MIDSALIVQPGFLGDAVLATGLVRILNDIVPAMNVGMLVRSTYQGLFQDHKGIAKIYGIDKRDRRDTARIVDQVRKAGYQLALIPHRSLRSQVIPYRAGIPKRVGFRQSAFSFLLTHKVEYQIAQHELERNASLLKETEVKNLRFDVRSWLNLAPDLLVVVEEKYKTDNPIVVVAPGSVWPTKCWSEEHFVQLCRMLQDGGWIVYLVGSRQEEPLCSRIAVNAGLKSKHVLAGELSLKELAALMSFADRAVVNDSAPLHIAEAVDTPVTAIFGPTVSEFGFSPYLSISTLLEGSLPCRPCGIHGHTVCPLGTHECMKAISPQLVFDSITNVGKQEGSS